MNRFSIGIVSIVLGLSLNLYAASNNSRDLESKKKAFATEARSQLAATVQLFYQIVQDVHQNKVSGDTCYRAGQLDERLKQFDTLRLDSMSWVHQAENDQDFMNSWKSPSTFLAPPSFYYVACSNGVDELTLSILKDKIESFRAAEKSLGLLPVTDFPPLK